VIGGRGDEAFADIPGLVWREEGMFREGPPARQLTREELDVLPLVDRSLIHHADMNSVAPVWRARGCPQRCDFCEVCEIWPKYVARDKENTIQELIGAQDAGYDSAFLIDDNAAANKPAFKDLLHTASARGFARLLVTQIRADAVFKRNGRLDRELLRLLKKAASVTVVCVGVESADDEDLERVNKGIDSKHMAKAMRAMRRYGLLVHGMFIALREDSKQTIKRNGEYARRYVTSLQYLFETPLPGTKRTAVHEESGAVMFRELEDLGLYDGMHVVVRPDLMQPGEMQKLVTREYERFYSAGRIVAAALRGTFLRFRRLSEGQRAYLSYMSPLRRLRWWFKFHFEYKFAPVGFLAVGHRRIRQMMHDSSYSQFNSRLGSM
jgi:radical SAM superfamily enzyme YgiQ (UPF0313 family)